MPISDSGYGADKAVFYTQAYKTLVRSQKEILLRGATVIPIINRNELYAYRFDIYRLLRSLSIDPHMWWTIAYLNGIENPQQDITKLTAIYNIDQQQIEKALARSDTTAS